MSLRFRQIHLDFHTSPAIQGIGAGFDPDEFADTLKRAHVDSVTCFARCHHGYIYFDTQKHPERRHPHLTTNLLPAQIEACHKRGIRVPIYTTIQWDQFTAEQHPEWLAVQPDGRIQGTPPYEAGFYRNLLVNTPYFDFLKEHVREVHEMMPVDGWFFDIVHNLDDSSVWTRRGMLAEGLNPSDAQQRQAYGLQVIDQFKREMTAFVRQFSPDCTIFYNGGHIGPSIRGAIDAYTHLELESLPSESQWGYMHYPLTVRYARNFGKDTLAMTGKFHTSWGDFHSFKNLAALQFECFRSLALGSRCSIGDQLHPEGKICPDTYDLIGKVYAEVEKKEPWCDGTKPLVEIGVLTNEEFTNVRLNKEPLGAVRMLQEGCHQFDIVDTRNDFDAYKVLVLPDRIPVSRVLADKLAAYLHRGGSLILSYRSGLMEEAEEFALPDFGIHFQGDAPFNPDFIYPQGSIGNGLPSTEHVIYQRGAKVEILPGSEVLASTIVPYFNRTWEHFCSHRHTPSSRLPGYPAIVRRDRVIYFAHPIFSQYYQNSPRWCRTLFLNALNLLLEEPLLRVKAPTTLQATLNAQEDQKRWVLHLLHYIPERRGIEIDILEDVIPLYNIEVSIRVNQPVKRVDCVPGNASLPFSLNDDGRIVFNVPEVNGHQMVEICFE